MKVITLKKTVMPLMRSVTILRKEDDDPGMRVLMMEMLMSPRSFMKTGIYETNRSKRLCIGQLMKQFLKEENGLSKVMEDTPDHLLHIEIFKRKDIIDGPLEVLPLRGKKWDVPYYERIAAHFREGPGFEREALKNMQ